MYNTKTSSLLLFFQLIKHASFFNSAMNYRAYSVGIQNYEEYVAKVNVSKIKQKKSKLIDFILKPIPD